METLFSRTERIIGKEGIETLQSKHVAVFGIGGVGSFVAEALVRAGVGAITMIDYDDIVVSNINRQIHATTKTVGRLKVDVMKERLLDINPDVNIHCIAEKYTSENAEDFFAEPYDYVVDAIDMVSSKLDLIERSTLKGIPIISSMGTGNKLDPSKLEVTDIYKTHMCPLAKVMRKELKNRSIKKLKVVYSTEEPIKPIRSQEEIDLQSKDKKAGRKVAPGSISFVPSSAGLLLASVVVNEFLNKGE